MDFAQQAPADLQPYVDAFQCPLRFDAPGYAVAFDCADVLRPLPTSNPLLAEMHDRLLGEGLDRLGQPSGPGADRAQAAEGEPEREEIASKYRSGAERDLAAPVALG